MFDPNIFDPNIFDVGVFNFIEWEVKNIVAPTSTSIPEIGDRFYIGKFPDKLEYPAVVMYSISRLDDMFDAGIMTERFQFSCYANYLSSATDIAENIKNKLKRYYGSPTSTEYYRILGSWFDNMIYLYESDISKHVRILDMIVRYMEV